MTHAGELYTWPSMAHFIDRSLRTASNDSGLVSTVLLGTCVSLPLTATPVGIIGLSTLE